MLSAKAIAREVEYDYLDSNTTGVYPLKDLDIKDATSDKFDLDNSKVYIYEDGVYVDLKGVGKYNGLYASTSTTSSVEIKEGVNYATTILGTSGEMIEDPTPDKNLRYSGENPNNYVRFNDELWRIIGIFNASNGTKIERRIKLIRKDSIGAYSWDSSAGTGEAGYGVNNWVASDLNLLLNDYYYNGKTGQKCYNGQNNRQVDCSFGSIGIKDTTADTLIENTVWTIGGNKYNNPSTPPYGLPTGIQYTAERGTTVYTAGTPTTHTAKIGLLFPSDYGYASTDTGCRTDLRAGATYNGSTYDYSGTKCKNNNWLHAGSTYWTISPDSGSSYYSFSISGVGVVSGNLAYRALDVHPVVYLKSDVKITGGIGTSSNPYILSA